MISNGSKIRANDPTNLFQNDLQSDSCLYFPSVYFSTQTHNILPTLMPQSPLVRTLCTCFSATGMKTCSQKHKNLQTRSWNSSLKQKDSVVFCTVVLLWLTGENFIAQPFELSLLTAHMGRKNTIFTHWRLSCKSVFLFTNSFRSRTCFMWLHVQPCHNNNNNKGLKREQGHI